MELTILVEFWHWWVLALCFIVFAGMLRAPIYAALTMSTGIMGIVVTQDPLMPIMLQLGIFTTVTLIFLVALNIWMRNRSQTDQKEPSEEAKNMIGIEFELSAPIQNGFGEVTVNGQHWSIKGPRIKKGTLVRVLKLDGNMLMVMPVDIIKQHQEEQEEAERNSRI